MNPLDPLELQAFVRNLNEEMPMHTETTAKIKRSYSQGMPKNLMEYSAHVDNRFLNDNLAIVEEIAHRDQKHPIPKWFRDYQIKHFASHGILKADGFFARDRIFGQMFPRKIYYGAGANYHSMGIASVIGNTKVLGADIEGGGTGAHSTGYDQLRGCKPANVGVIGTVYNRLAINNFSIGSGSQQIIGCYDNSGSSPNNLLGQTATHAGATGFNWINATAEFELTTTQIWLIMQSETWAQADIYRNNVSALDTYHTRTFGTLPNPWATGGGGDTAAINIKVGHS